MGRLSRFCQPYFIVNTALVLCWFVLRQWLDIRALSNAFMGSFVSGEVALFFSMTLYLYKKFKRCNSWDSFLAKSFLFYQSLVAFMLFYVSYRTMFLYGIACLISFLMCRQPAGMTSPLVVELDEIEFEAQIASKKEHKDDVAWMVFFTANWHPECTFFSYTFADMAEKFGQDGHIKFGRLDDRHKGVFDQHQVRVIAAFVFTCL